MIKKIVDRPQAEFLWSLDPFVLMAQKVGTDRGKSAVLEMVTGVPMPTTQEEVVMAAPFPKAQQETTHGLPSLRQLRANHFETGQIEPRQSPLDREASKRDVWFVTERGFVVHSRYHLK